MAKEGNGRSTPAVILVVDDDASVRLLARAALEPAGFKVEESPNGEHALQKLDRLRPDLVLTDIVMPEMDGYTMCKALRQLPSCKHLPVVIMTGRDDIESIERAYDVGATDFVTKPINYPLLTRRLSYLLRAKQIADELRRSEVRLSNAQRIAKIGHWEWDTQANAVYCSAGVREILGDTSANPFLDIEGLLAWIHADDRETVRHTIMRGIEEKTDYSVTFRIVHPDWPERVVQQETEFKLREDGSLLGATGTIQDVTDQKVSEEKIRYLSYYDPLTDLPNRTLFAQNLKRAIKSAKRYERSLGVLLLDLDNFRRFNETLGYHVGDEILREVAKRLCACTRGSDLVARDIAGFAGEHHYEEMRGDVARLGGDEFVILLPEIRLMDSSVFLAKRIIETLSAPFIVENREFYLTVSIGISAYPLDSDESDILLKHAEVAMNHVKQKGRNQYQFYRRSLDISAKRKLSIETQLHSAIEKEQFEVYYQPRINVQDNQPAGLEALVRWRHPERGIVSPLEFIPVAEETGLILPLGEWVLRTACLETLKMHGMDVGSPTVSINLSAAQFRQKGPARRITQIVEDTGLDPQFIELELTEGLLLEDKHTSLATLRELREFGLSMSVDDFGTGYSSLSYLKRLPVDALKIDQSFVQGVDKDGSDAAIVEAIIALAHSLRLKLVAEGVERTDQLEFLRARGCDEAQGYLFCEPIPLDDVVQWISREFFSPSFEQSITTNSPLVVDAAG